MKASRIIDSMSSAHSKAVGKGLPSAKEAKYFDIGEKMLDSDIVNMGTKKKIVKNMEKVFNDNSKKIGEIYKKADELASVNEAKSIGDITSGIDIPFIKGRISKQEFVDAIRNDIKYLKGTDDYRLIVNKLKGLPDTMNFEEAHELAKRIGSTSGFQNKQLVKQSYGKIKELIKSKIDELSSPEISDELAMRDSLHNKWNDILKGVDFTKRRQPPKSLGGLIWKAVDMMDVPRAVTAKHKSNFVNWLSLKYSGSDIYNKITKGELPILYQTFVTEEKSKDNNKNINGKEVMGEIPKSNETEQY
jgi:hypothetical protein